MLRKERDFPLILLFLLIAIAIWVVMNFYRKDKIENFQRENFATMASMAEQKIDTLIDEKGNATLSIALSLTKNSDIEKALIQKSDIQPLLLSLSQELNHNTDFKNVWIQLVDNRGISLARSWDSQKNDDISAVRSDVKKILTTPQIMTSISVGKYDLTFKAMTPIYDKNSRFLGFIEVISHFNSIAKKLEYEGYKTIIIVDKRYTNQLQKPFTKLFVNEHYIANKNADKTILADIERHGLDYFIDPHQTYKIDVPSRQLIIRHPLYTIDKTPIATFLLFKPLSSIDTSYEYYITVITYLIFFTVVIILIFILFFYIKQKANLQKIKTILDAQHSIVIISDGKRISEVNHAFLNFFGYRNLSDFLQHYHCICDFFEKNDRFFHLEKISPDASWIDILSTYPNADRIVMMTDKEGKKHAFHTEITLISDSFKVVSFTDISETMEENLELQSKIFFDPLTKVRNRYFFEMNTNNFIQTSKLQHKELALTMLDIDYFKQVNDTYGHNVGDKILQSLAELIKGSLRVEDEIIRWGGEEFIILIMVTSLESATQIIENLRNTIEMHTFEENPKITCSFGITLYQKDEPILQTIARADKALYDAKSSGRNRVISI
ncbi:MAG: diguanylate cyclase [Sulfuricurvum sp.]|uniref:diguanylate cyclase n=1 Tax=Sulfuricurvum sp. TaxID=2025608 RepID=UPI0026379A81|nr:diguanylate cyclase [Sulfuricurvum sp.]MDD2370028.1 diguanylate cyclase [Sulfuricurvum sp.]MDD2949707.1 diguanylate cyclase [Sulfuricurvum sp.]MDD5118914.1 diguanylate cyclase [Sulfuricurvum sp.]